MKQSGGALKKAGAASIEQPEGIDKRGIAGMTKRRPIFTVAREAKM